MPHILVVEDDASYAYALSRILTRSGMRVTIAADGERALENEAADPCDAVVLDLRMPGLHGSHVARRLRLSRPGLPIVVLTGVPDEIGDAPVDVLLTKTSSPSDVLYHLTALTGSKA